MTSIRKWGLSAHTQSAGGPLESSTARPGATEFVHTACLNQPSLAAWFDGLREEGWFRDPDVPGVKTSTGTIVYAFHYLGAAEQRGA